MKVLPVRFLADVELDLRRIASRLKRRGASELAVARYFQRIIDHAVAIASAPEGYPIMEALGPDVRIVQFEHSARIAYRVADDAVEIITVFYRGQDI